MRLPFVPLEVIGESAGADAEERDIMRQTRHKSVEPQRRYIRDGSLFRNNAAATVGL
jgi:hypothetical protein